MTMYHQTTDFLAGYKIGIIGGGYLGRALATAFLEHHLPPERFLVSYGGNPTTLENLCQAGLGHNIATSDEICRKSDIIFITIKPQDLKSLKLLSFSGAAIVVSCMAGIDLATLKKALGIGALRIMPSNPETIQAGRGIVAIYPQHEAITGLLSRIGLKVYQMPNEELMHLFTVGVCLPTVLPVAYQKHLATADAIRVIAAEFHYFNDIYRWSIDVAPTFGSVQAQTEYLKQATTKGGITEAIVDSIDSGDDFLTALRKGAARSKELAAKAGHS